MTARLAGPGDARAIAELLDRFNAEFDCWSPPTSDAARRLTGMLAAADAYAVVAESLEFTGFALVTLRPSPYYDGPVATLDEMYVVPERRGQGIGGEMMGVLLEVARERLCGEVQINVDEGDEGARRFYEHHGFTNVEPDSVERMLCFIQEL